MHRIAVAFIAPFVLVMAVAVPSHAQVADHLQCYKIKDPMKLQAFVDLDSPQFGVAPNCKVGPAKLFCVPATKTIVSAVDKATGSPITPLSFWSPPAAGDRICYKAKCPEPFPADQQVTDQFGTRMLTKFKSSLVCTPAVKGATPNADAFRGFPASGQTTAYTADKNDGIGGAVAVPDDGTVEAGATLSYADNGDGTVTDNNTALMWGKKDDNNVGGLHDKDTLYIWSGAGTQETIWDWLDDVNAEGGTGFAGYNDWRIPTNKELQSIVNYESSPSVSLAFNTGCAPGCTVLTCSCTYGTYWSSTTFPGSPTNAWVVNFGNGFVNGFSKVSNVGVRAVRGGS